MLKNQKIEHNSLHQMNVPSNCFDDTNQGYQNGARSARKPRKKNAETEFAFN